MTATLVFFVVRALAHTISYHMYILESHTRTTSKHSSAVARKSKSHKTLNVTSDSTGWRVSGDRGSAGKGLRRGGARGAGDTLTHGSSLTRQHFI